MSIPNQAAGSVHDLGRLDSPRRSQGRRGVLLVGHGTRDPRGVEQFFALSETLQHANKQWQVAPALLEFHERTIAEGWRSLMAAEVTHVHVAPLLLFAAGHARQDVPAEVEACLKEFPGTSYDQTLPLSRHRRIIETAADRINRIGPAGDDKRTALVMVGRGNRHPCAQADMRVLSEIVSKRISAAVVFTAFYAMAEPKLIDVLQAVGESQRFDRVIVYPHLLFQGRLYEAIEGQMRAAAEKHVELEWCLADYLYAPGEDAIAAAVVDRVDQAWARGQYR